MADNFGQLVRTFSSSNFHASKRIHEYVSTQRKTMDQDVNIAKDVTKSSMVIPTLSKIVLEHNGHLARYSIGLVADVNALESLEEDGIINWCPRARTLIPLNTDSDGNCLLHALSIYIWGVHDRKLNLRSFLHQKMQMAPRSGNLYRRWKFAQEESLRGLQLSLPSVDLTMDWETVVSNSSTLEFPMGNMGQKYAPLEDIHIFAMSNILARPIIVLSEKVHHGINGGSLQQNQISGIYLPLLRDPYHCERSPIVIGYLRGHFVPLLSGEDLDMLITKRYVHQDAQHFIPLVYNDLSDIPVRFLMQNEDRVNSLGRYIDRHSLPVRDEVFKEAVMLKFRSPPAWSVELMFSLYCKAQEAFSEHISSVPGANRTAGDYTTRVSATAYDPSYSFSDKTPCVSQQWSNQVYCQASPNWSSNDRTTISVQSRPEKFLCVRSMFDGCENFGEERYGRKCKECYDKQYFEMSPGKRFGDLEMSEAYVNAQKPAKYDGREDLKVLEPPSAVSGKESALGSCVVLRCKGQGKSELKDMCEACFRERMNMHSDPLRGEIRSGPTEEPVKRLCADPGCQEDRVPGKDKCAEHLSHKVTCITENCGKKAVDNEIPLCSECRRKNVEACQAKLPNSPPATQPEVLAARTRAGRQPDFSHPAIYHGFNRAGVSKSKVLDPHREYQQPEWQSGMEPRRSRQLHCADPACRNYAAQGKDGRCNECYDVNDRIRASEYESQRSERLAKRPVSTQQFGIAGQKVPGYSVSPAVQSYISSQMRRAALGETPSSTKLTSSTKLASTRDDDRDDESQGKFGMKRSSQRYLPNESDYEILPSRKSERSYETGRSDDIEHIYTEIGPAYVDRVGLHRESAAYRAPTKETPPELPRESPRMQGAFVNEAYAPGVYSMMEDRSQIEFQCVKCGGVHSGRVDENGLCAVCQVESRKKEKEQDKFQAPKRAYVDQKPCKTRGCPRFADWSNGEFCEACLQRSMENPQQSATSSSGNVSSSSYVVGGFGESRREASMAGRKQPNNCATPSCGFFASGEYGPFCSKCFMEKTKLDTVNPVIGVDPLMPSDGQGWPYFSRGSDSSACRRQGCEHFGRPERNGYCSQCYELFY